MVWKAWIFVAILASFLFHTSRGDRVILLQRPKPGVTGYLSWYWTTWHSGDQSAGWVGTTGGKRTYDVCDIGVNQPSNWLWSNGFPHNDLKRIDITINYTIARRCASLDDPHTRQNCKEQFDIYAYQATENSNKSDSHPRNGKYRKVKTISLPSNLSSISWSEKLSLPIEEGTSEVFLAVHDQGACLVLNSFLVTYNVCPEKVLPGSLILLPLTVAPTNESEIVKIVGRCGDHSEPTSSELDAICGTSGEWLQANSPKEACLCKPGWEIAVTKCQECPLRFFKGELGNTKCTKCPVNSVTGTGRKYCKCRRGFFRAPWEGISDNCTALPFAPSHLRKEDKNQTTVVLSWSRPRHLGGRTDLHYDIDCKVVCRKEQKSCSQDCGSQVLFLPSRRNLSHTKVTVANLFPYTTYRFRVYSKTGVSAVAEKEGFPSKYARLEVTTLASAPGQPVVTVTRIDSTSVYVSWTLVNDNDSIEYFLVRYYKLEDGSDRHTKNTTETSITINGLDPDAEYRFVVVAKNSMGYGPRSEEAKTQGSRIGGSSLSHFSYIVIFIVLGIILFIVLTVLSVYCYCQRKPRHRPMQRLGNLQDTQENLPLEAESIHMHHILPEINTDEAENDALYMDICETHTFELERKDIIFERLLGSGNFGEVHKAIIGNNTVAVKSLKENATPKDKEDMITELNVMESLNPHPHVVKLIGCCSLRDPLLIVLEYLPYGDLLGYLRKSRGHADVYNSGEKTPTSSLSANDLLSFAWMIADGMEYLAKMKVVHRDLAARNILVGENKICKISDFGLARDVSADVYVRTSQARLPVKWMPPESFFRGESSTMSDVWSYGIVLWEVFTIGDSPYPRVEGKNMAALLERGYRMPRPMHISNELYAIMSECWSEKPEERPSFHWICAAVKRLIDDEKIYINLDYYNDEDYVNFDMIEELQ